MIDVAPETALNRFVGQRVAGGQMDDRPDVFGFCDVNKLFWIEPLTQMDDRPDVFGFCDKNDISAGHCDIRWMTARMYSGFATDTDFIIVSLTITDG